jgi:hypothetical protein
MSQRRMLQRRGMFDRPRRAGRVEGASDGVSRRGTDAACLRCETYGIGGRRAVVGTDDPGMPRTRLLRYESGFFGFCGVIDFS